MDFSQKDPSSHWDTFSIEREECCSKAFSSQLHLKNGRLSSTSHMLSLRSEACTARFHALNAGICSSYRDVEYLPNFGMSQLVALDPESGRWTAKEPATFNSGGTNLYEYAYND